jgi:D-alanyl-D-alanine carboxypeptidase
VATKTFTDFALRRGDNDAANKLGGASHAADSGSPVEDLQAALASVGVYDGDLGGQTQTAVKRFQWNVANVKGRIVNGAFEARQPSPTIKVTGVADAATAGELKNWIDVRAQATGNLVRVNVADFPSFTAEFKHIDNPTVEADDMLVDATFIDSLKALHKAAEDAQVKLAIIQAFRVEGAPVTETVVTPASKSQHLIGHAIDCNILDGDKRINSETFKRGRQTAAANKFVEGAKKADLRWGGDFSKRDFVHFDDFVKPNGEGYSMRFFFNQRMISNKNPIPPA